MRIGINLIAQGNEKGTGTWRYIMLILRHLEHYDLSEHTFIIYKQRSLSKSYLALPSSLNIEFVDVPDMKSRFQRIIFEQTLFYRYISPCDVFYSYCTSMPLMVKARRVFTLHDVYYLSNRERYSWFKRFYLQWMTRLYIRRSHKVLTVSEYSKSEILKYYKEAEEKLEITYNFLENNSPIRYDCQEFEINGVTLQRHNYFLYVGSIQPSKNILRLVEAFKVFHSKHKGYKLIIAGKPTYKGDEIIRKLQNTDGVSYVGFVSRKQLEMLFSNCMATCLISLCEGFGIPVLESYAFGRPVLVSNVSSLPEVAGKASIYVDPIDVHSIARGFEQLVENVENLIIHIPQQISKFDADKSCKIFLASLGIENIQHK